jgi:hypothetical protein
MTDRKKTRIDHKDYLIMAMIKDGNPSVHEMRIAIRAKSPGTIAERLKWLETREKPLIVQPKVRQPRSRKLTIYGIDALYDAGMMSKEEYEKIRLSNRVGSPP